MAGESETHGDFVSGFAKGLRVIEAFGADAPRLSIADVARATRLDRATARRCLLTLNELGYAHHDGKFFTLTPRVLRLGTACLASMPLPQIVQGPIDDLSDQIGQSTSVSILDNAEIVYVARAAQRRVISISLMPGSRLPAYCTSMGRVLMAALRDEDVRGLIAKSELRARTWMTVTDPEALMERIAKVRRDGYAVIDQEVELGLRSIAVPLLDSAGHTVAALNVGVAATQASADELPGMYLQPLLATQTTLRTLLPPMAVV